MPDNRKPMSAVRRICLLLRTAVLTISIALLVGGVCWAASSCFVPEASDAPARFAYPDYRLYPMTQPISGADWLYFNESVSPRYSYRDTYNMSMQNGRPVLYVFRAERAMAANLPSRPNAQHRFAGGVWISVFAIAFGAAGGFFLHLPFRRKADRTQIVCNSPSN